MNMLKCELCNSVDIVKDGEYFVCQHCGCKYTAEDAKKMMIEGTVDIQGTVKVDNSDYVQKFLDNARRAKSKEDWEETEKYYNMVEQNDPSNIEAIFYSSYGKAKQSLLDGDLYKRQAAFKVLRNCISIIDDNYDKEKDDENKNTLLQISNDIIAMACSNYVYNHKVNGYGIETWSDKNDTITLFNNLHAEFASSLLNIITMYPQEEAKNTIYMYELIIKHYQFMIENGKLANKSIWQERIMEMHKKLNEIDSSHIIPEQAPTPNSSDGCYVATAVYGSYDCPEVWVLRRYRDEILSKTLFGRIFIHFYYAVSPGFVHLFGKRKWFNAIFKHQLEKIVISLRNKGVSDSPYNDIDWRNM